jgi:DNA (cytosine-5)-methyltransferase 1
MAPLQKTTGDEARQPTAISLFSGAGGLDLGVVRAGARVAICVEPDPYCVATLGANQKRHKWKVLPEPIQNYSTPQLLAAAGLGEGQATLVVGGPPCQPFSKSGFWVEGRKGVRDERNLLGEFVRVVREARPLGFIMENVFGLFYKTSKTAFDQLFEELTDEGYTITHRVVNAADYGVPQIRERLFILGSRVNTHLDFPEGTHADSDSYGRQKRSRRGSELLELFPKSPWVTAGEAIGDLSQRFSRSAELQYNGRWKKQLEEIPRGRNYLYFTAHEGHPRPIWKWRSRYWSFLLKLSPEKPSWTIQAQPGPAIGPFHWNSRYLSDLEMKRLQTFPDDYEFVGPRREVQRQLGNAVPPLLASAITRSLLAQIHAAVSDTPAKIHASAV